MTDQEISRVRSMTLAQLAPNEGWRISLPHTRPRHLVLVLTRGQGLAVVAGRRRGLSAQSVVFVPAGTQMMLELTRQSYGQAVLIPTDVRVSLPATPVHMRLQGAAEGTELMSLIETIQREQAVRRPFHDEAMEASAGLLSVWLRRQLAEGPAALPAEKSQERLARAYCELMEQEFRSGLSMADFAARLEVSPTHLTRVLRQTSGQTAADLLTGRCLHEARVQLQDGSAPIGAISDALGFSSAAYFTRFIQKHTGHTPSALRREH